MWMDKIHGEYLEDFGLYQTLMRLTETNEDHEICNAFLKRAGYSFNVEKMINKSFVAIACSFASVLVLYVHDRSYVLAMLPYDLYQQKLKNRHPTWDVEGILEQLPSF